MFFFTNIFVFCFYFFFYPHMICSAYDHRKKINTTPGYQIHLPLSPSFLSVFTLHVLHLVQIALKSWLYHYFLDHNL